MGALTLNNKLELRSGTGDIVLNGTVDGAQDLLIEANTANVTFNGNVGGTTALTDLTVASANQINVGANATVAGNVTMTAPVNLIANSIVDTSSANGNAVINGALDGAYSFTAITGTGGIAVGSIGATTALFTGFLGLVSGQLGSLGAGPAFDGWRRALSPYGRSTFRECGSTSNSWPGVPE